MKIAMLRNVYQPDIQGHRKPAVLEDYFDAVDEAESYVSKLDHEIYVTSNTEADRPDYYILDDVDADYIESGRNQDMSNYDWDNCTCDRNDGDCCGECDECLNLMIDQDRQYVVNNALNMTLP